MAARTPTQNRRIWMLVGQLGSAQGLSQDDAKDVLRQLCVEVSGQAHSSELTEAQAGVVIAGLAARVDGRRAPAPPPQRRRPSPPPTDKDPNAVVTPAQLDALEALRATLGMTAEGYKSFCSRMKLPAWPQTRGDAAKVYEGLEAMLKRRYPRAALLALAQSIADADAPSSQDHEFARSIVTALNARKGMSAGRIGILLKIGRRYGLGVPAQATVGQPG